MAVQEVPDEATSSIWKTPWRTDTSTQKKAAISFSNPLPSKSLSQEISKDQLDKSLLDLEKKIVNFEKRMKTTESSEQKTFLKKRIEMHQEEYEVLKMEKMKKDLAEASEDISCERQKVEKLEQERNEYQEKIERIEKEKTVEVGKLEEKVRQLQEKLEEKESANDAAQNEVKSLKNETDELKRKNKKLKEESQKTAIQSTQRIDEQEEFLETNRQQIGTLTKEIEQLKAKEETFKSQLREKEEELIKVSNQLKEKCAQIKILLEAMKQKESNQERQLPKIEADKRLVDQLTQQNDKLKEELDEIGKELKEKEELFDKQEEKIEALQAINKKLTEDGINKESKLQDTRDHLQEVEDKLAKNMEEKDEVIASLQQAVEVRSETVSQMKQALDQQMMTANEQLEAKQKQIDQLVEELQVKEAQSAIYKQDFETERNDRQKLHQSYTNLQAHCQFLKQKLTEEEEKFTTVQKQHHELQLKYETDKKQLINQIKELKEGETDRVKGMEEEIQVLTAQVNAYSREVDRQKRLVTQSQEKHKTEVIQLEEKLDSEVKFKTTEHRKIVDEKQKLVTKTSELERNLTAELKSKGQQQQQISELNRRLTNETKAKQQLAQQFDTLSANYEKLLTKYHEEQAMVTRLEDQMKKMKQANVVLKDKIQQLENTTDSRSIRKPQNPHSTPAPAPKPVVQNDGNAVLVVSKTEGVTPAHHTDSDSVPEDSPALKSQEEMTRMFKPYNQQGSSDWTQSPHQVEDSSLAAQKVQPTEESLVAEQHRQELARKADNALLEVDRMRRQADLKQTNNDSNTQDQSRPKGQLTREEAEKGRRSNTFQDTASKGKPAHPQPKANDNQGKQQPTNDDSDSDIEENKLIDNIDEEIQRMAEDVRKGSRGPTTAEVMFDDGDSLLPYDPNLVCPKCGKQYRVGEIQKLRRHINEFCTGIR